MSSQLTYMSHNVVALIAAASALLILYPPLRALFSPLRDVKGPALARYTRLWEMYKNWQGHLEHVTVALHKQYGSLIPPNVNVCTNKCFEALSSGSHLIVTALAIRPRSALFTALAPNSTNPITTLSLVHPLWITRTSSLRRAMRCMRSNGRRPPTCTP